MPRLLRPPIDLETKLRVLLRSLGEMFSEDVIACVRESRYLGSLVKTKQAALAEMIGCAPEDIDYDHDPPLGARQKVFKDGVHVEYVPRANDPDHLFARNRTLHRIKTNVRGEHGQHPDRVLIKKNRRLERREEEAAGLRRPKPKVKMRSRSNWPPKGSRRLNWRKKP